MEREPWTCSRCDQRGTCEICESCAEHCDAKHPNDLAAHRRLDHVIASTDPKLRPN